MFKYIIAVMASVAALLFGTAGTAQAEANPAVCQGIDEAPSYEIYLIDAYVYGKAFDYSPRQQARNIVDSVMAYCPWHKDGILAAAGQLANAA